MTFLFVLFVRTITLPLNREQPVCDECLLPPSEQFSTETIMSPLLEINNTAVSGTRAPPTQAHRGCVSKTGCCLPRQHLWASSACSEKKKRCLERAHDAHTVCRTASDAQKCCMGRQLTLGSSQRRLWFICLFSSCHCR